MSDDDIMGKRICNIASKVTPEEEQLIRSIAMARDISVSDLVRAACLREIDEHRSLYQ